ncbi:DUF4153 domain-containing protein [Stutzerimonas stutzeri]|uniref:DUF4153 domain-containing protein n=1 Tax=Stutzerimonas stutzeri TaxID=316 RepID=A0A2S4AM26_STUST|nr:DUF4153 domain-containing protein [Stutzerimonas stutzeri]MCQ4264051.1 DUF4153 domain-containing protein [Stutzerimonas stutzeri]POH82057.1 DUF4153 domain-containing protein [Stutzerimonas stutzeri]
MQLAIEQRPLMVYLAVGLLQGLTLWMASESWPHGIIWRSLCSALIVLVVVGGWQLQMLWGQLREAERWKLLLPAILLPAALAAWLAVQFDQPRWYYFDETTGTLLLWSQLALAYILTPFIQARDSAHSWRFDYSALYRNAWNNGLLLFMAFVMLGVFWLLIWLWAGLFSMLGVDQFKRLFSSSGFVWVASATVIAAGLRIGQERGQVIDALRNVLQAMCRFLLPLTVVILLLFVVFLPFTGLAPLWATRHATPILLALVFAHIALLNGVVQDGLQAAHYPRPLRLLADASSLCLPLLAGLAMHALWLRIDQYGLTPDRVLAALLALVALVHGLALVRAVLRRDPAWLSGLRQSNPPLALFAACLLVLMHVPMLSPLQLSAANQYQRLLDTTLPAERTDLGALRFQLGEPGRRYLQVLREELGKPWEDEALRIRLQADLQRLDGAEHYWAWTREQEVAAAPPVPWIGEPVADDDGSLARAVNYQGCVDKCRLFAVDLDRDGQSEVLLLRAEPWVVPVFGQAAAGSWDRIGQLRVTAGVLPDSDVLSEILQRSDFELVAPRFNAIEIDGVRLEPAIGEP